jgi:hypothetical protein
MSDQPIEETRPGYISVTQVRQWLKCQMQFYFARIARRKGKYGVKMALGIGVHAGIAQANMLRQNGIKPDLDLVFEAHDLELEKELSTREYIYDDMRTPEEIKRRGQKVLRTFVPHLDHLTGLPMLIEHKIDGGIVMEDGTELTGYIDLVDVNGSIYDFKIGKKPKSQKDADKDLQLSLYTFAIHGNSPQPTKVSLVSGDSKTGDPSVAESFRTGEDAVKAYKVVNAVSKQIEAAMKDQNFVPSTEGWWCSPDYCEFWDQCPFGGGKNVEVDH